jgi:phosphatidylinositol alpha-1,6-mannosyltransferase
MIIRALPQVIKQIPQAVYLIIGSGPSQKILEDLVNQNGLRDQVKFLGAVPQHDLSAYYYLCHVLAMPNRQLENGDVEGFGTVFLEANLFGKPVIGGRSGGAPEAIINGKTGLLVSPTSVDEITAALIKILSDPAYGERLGMQGLERVVNEFDWPTQTEKIKEILK